MAKVKIDEDLVQSLKQFVDSQKSTDDSADSGPVFKIKVGDATKEVRSQEEAQRLFDEYQAQVAADAQAKAVQAEADRQAQEAAAQAAAQAQSRQQHGQRQDDFDNNEFAKLFLEDPRKAQRYAMSKDPDMIGLFAGISNQLTALRQEAAASQFLLSHPEYNATPENYKALEGIVTQFNLPWDLNGMNLAYVVAQQSGLIKVKTTAGRSQDTDQEDDVQQEAIPAPPSLGRRKQSAVNQEADAVIADFERMTSAQQKQYLEQFSR